MTKLSISFAAALLSVSLAPTAHAYGFEPERGVATPIAVSSPQTAEAEGVCTVSITPLLASILALPDDWRGSVDAATQSAVACAVDD